jgi:hypothetical protein
MRARPSGSAAAGARNETGRVTVSSVDGRTIGIRLLQDMAHVTGRAVARGDDIKYLRPPLQSPH